MSHRHRGRRRHRCRMRSSTRLPLDENGRRVPQPPPTVIDQVDKEYVPYVTPVRVGTAVSFPNHDQIRHHVYSFSPAKQLRDPPLQGHSPRPDPLRQARTGDARLQHPRLDDGLRVRLGVALFRPDPRRRQRRRAGSPARELLRPGLAPADQGRTGVHQPGASPWPTVRTARCSSRSNRGTCGVRGVRRPPGVGRAIAEPASERPSVVPFHFQSFRARILSFVFGLLVLVQVAVLLAVNAANVREARRHVDEALELTASFTSPLPALARGDPARKGAAALCRLRIQEGLRHW